MSSDWLCPAVLQLITKASKKKMRANNLIINSHTRTIEHFIEDYLNFKVSYKYLTIGQDICKQITTKFYL